MKKRKKVAFIYRSQFYIEKHFFCVLPRSKGSAPTTIFHTIIVFSFKKDVIDEVRCKNEYFFEILVFSLNHFVKIWALKSNCRKNTATQFAKKLSQNCFAAINPSFKKVCCVSFSKNSLEVHSFPIHGKNGLKIAGNAVFSREAF